MGVSPEKRFSFPPNFLLNLNWNLFMWLSFAFSHSEGPAK